MNNGDEPAYPMDYTKQQTHGLTKREAFAMAAMQGLLAGRDGDFRAFAIDAVDAADALLNALKEPK